MPLFPIFNVQAEHVIDGKTLLERLHSLGFTHDATLEHITRTDFEVEGVRPREAIAAVTVCRVLMRDLRLMYSSYADVSIVRDCFDKLDTPGKREAMGLFANTGFYAWDTSLYTITPYFCIVRTNKVKPHLIPLCNTRIRRLPFIACALKPLPPSSLFPPPLPP